MEIRVLTVADATAYWAVRLQALRDYPASFGASYEDSLERPLAEIEKQIANVGGSPDSFIMGAWDGDTLVGTTGMMRSTATKVRHHGNVWGVYVVPEMQGQGLARTLLDAVIARARAIPGLEQLHLGVAVGNAPAQRLYRAAGFTVYGVEPHAMKLATGYVDEELMVLMLTPSAESDPPTG